MVSSRKSEVKLRGQLVRETDSAVLDSVLGLFTCLLSLISPGVCQVHVHWVSDAFHPSHPAALFSFCVQYFPAWVYVVPWASQVVQWKELACHCRRCEVNPWVGKNPWSRKGQPTPVFLPGVYGQRSLVGYSPWVCKELDTTERQSSCTESAIGNTVLPPVRKRGDAKPGSQAWPHSLYMNLFKEPNIYIYICIYIYMFFSYYKNQHIRHLLLFSH